jgi:hypothetical protein
MSDEAYMTDCTVISQPSQHRTAGRQSIHCMNADTGGMDGIKNPVNMLICIVYYSTDIHLSHC